MNMTEEQLKIARILELADLYEADGDKLEDAGDNRPLATYNHGKAWGLRHAVRMLEGTDAS